MVYLRPIRRQVLRGTDPLSCSRELHRLPKRRPPTTRRTHSAIVKHLTQSDSWPVVLEGISVVVLYEEEVMEEPLARGPAMPLSEEDRPVEIQPSSGTGAHLSITAEELINLRLVARGTTEPSLIIRHGSVLALHTGELLERDVVVSGRHIAAITPWAHFPRIKNEVDARGKLISPGFIGTQLCSSP
jgi:hypothetical protein